MKKSLMVTLVFLATATMLAGGGGMAERKVARTLGEWRAINPALTQYQPLHQHFVPGMGIHWGAPGPHLTLCVGPGNIVTCVEVIYPPAIGWHPWFDQPEGKPMELEGFGPAYTQHIYIADPATIKPGQRPTLLPLTLEALRKANPALKQYEKISEYVPKMGYHYGVKGPGIVLVVSPEGQINGFELIVPVEQGWYPWFDQPKGKPMELPGLGKVYTQHLYVVNPATLP